MYSLICLLLVVSVSTEACVHQLCNRYYNSRAYTLNIDEAANGTLSGTYQPSRKSNVSYPLMGTYSGEALPCTLGWSISDSNGTSSEYTTSWTGLATLGDPDRCDGTPVCDPYTVYLVVQYHTSRVVVPQDYWTSTVTGLDIFWNQSTLSEYP